MADARDIAKGKAEKRSLSSEAALLERTLLRLELQASGSLLGTITARAFALAVPPQLLGRDLRLLQLADEVAATGSLAFRDHARLYLALVACSWCKRPHATRRTRAAALIAAVALASASRQPLRAAMGVQDELLVLAHSTAFDERVRGVAAAVVSEEPPDDLEVERVLRAALSRVESEVAAEDSERARLRAERPPA